MAKLVITDSYFGVFDELVKLIDKNEGQLNNKNLIFCEEKVSLMAERAITSSVGSTFKTEVYSFGNYLRAKKPLNKILSKEGSAMVTARVISGMPLKKLSHSRENLAPSLFELIAQLKSARVTPENLLNASQSVGGVLKDKLIDISAVFSGYEQFITDNGYEDQNSALSYLPSLIENDADITKANVFIVGFSGFTSQLRSAITALLKKAQSVTAILTGGDNMFAYVNEAPKIFTSLCAQAGVGCDCYCVASILKPEAKMLAQTMFNPSAYAKKQYPTKDVCFFAAGNVYQECERTAQAIRTLILNGARYRDISVAVPDTCAYKDALKVAFSALEIPYFLDERKAPLSHPLIKLIMAYVDVKRLGFERKAFTAFFKNPLICENKKLADGFENYIIKYNIEYGGLTRPLFDNGDERVCEYERFRAELVAYFDGFCISKLLDKCSAQEKLTVYANSLREMGLHDQASVTEQIFGAVKEIVDQIQAILGNSQINFNEYKRVLTSGINALKLSVIPQYNDAVFVGGFKEVGLIKNNHLFVLGLTQSVPGAKEDVALLSDSDINALESVKLLIEPKIKIVNHRVRENVAMALVAFEKRLYLSYPITDAVGKKNNRSEILEYVSKIFTTEPYPEENGYLAVKQGLKSFAKSVGEYADCLTEEPVKAFSFYQAYGSFNQGEQVMQSILQSSQKQLKIRLDQNKKAVVGNLTSPTAIEDFYKCPYRSFLVHGLKLKPRENGKVDALSVGNFMHEALSYYMLRIDEVTDRASSDALFEQIKQAVLQKDEYSKFLLESETAYALERVAKECKKYCWLNFNYSKNSDFKTEFTELKFGVSSKEQSGVVLPAISLANGAVKLSGTIDRVDTCGHYYRIIDYKTGKVDDTDKALFSGTKLQLYLYSAVLKERKLAGAYYLPISDEYVADDEQKGAFVIGKTLDQTQALFAQDKNLKESGKSDFINVSVQGDSVSKALCENELNAYVDYAIAVSESAAKNMLEGFIAPSPYEEMCKYCEFGAMCGVGDKQERKLKGVDKNVITQAVFNNVQAEEGDKRDE